MKFNRGDAVHCTLYNGRRLTGIVTHHTEDEVWANWDEGFGFGYAHVDRVTLLQRANTTQARIAHKAHTQELVL